MSFSPAPNTQSYGGSYGQVGHPQDAGSKLQGAIEGTLGEMIDTRAKVTNSSGQTMNLAGKTDNLGVAANRYKNSTKSEHNKMWYKNKQWGICLFFGVIVLIVVIAVPIAVTARNRN